MWKLAPAAVLILLVGADVPPVRAQVPSPDPVGRAETLLLAARSIADLQAIVALLTPLEGQIQAPADRVRTYRVLALARVRMRDDDRAFESASACEQALGSGANDAVRADIAFVRGRVAERRGLFRESLAQHRMELDYATKAASAPLMSRAYDRLSALTLNTGEHALALEYAQRGYDVLQSPTDDQRRRYHMFMGAAYEEVNEIVKAEQHYAAALEVAQKQNDARAIADVYGAWAILYARNDSDPERARRYYDEALRILAHPSDESLWGVRGSVLNNSANLLRDHAATWDEAERRYREAIAISLRFRFSDLLPFAQKNLGRVYRQRGLAAESESLLLAAVAGADETGVARIRWQARMELGTLLREREPERAEKYLRECLELLEGQHSNVLLQDYAAGALSRDLNTNDNPYELLINLLLDRGRPDEAWLVAERSRARAFLDQLARSREELSDRLPADFVRGERDLLRRISAEQARLRDPQLTRPQLDAIASAIRAAEEQLAQLRVRLATEHPEVAHARYPNLVTLAELRRHLHPDEAIVEYFLGAERSVLWTVRRDSVTVSRPAGRAAIAGAVRAFTEALSTPQSAYDAAGRAAAEAVMPGGIATIAGARRLVVIPDGILYYLPFEALIDNGGRFLVESAAVSYSPSAASLSFLQARPEAAAGEVLAVGNPTLDTNAGADTERAMTIERMGLLKPLPHTSRELAAVAASYRGGTEILQRDLATEPELLRAGLASAAIVHFATHGLVDEEDPQRSGLALAAAPASDGILQMREIYRLHMNASLVTLSACQTALGKQVSGEGMIGLSRAFFYAGARAVMASLWNVNDASTADFMTAFYGSLAGGRSIEDAARQAKLSFLQRDRTKHPYHWAAFVVTGDAGRPVRVARPKLAGWAAAGAGLLLVAVCAALDVRRRQYRVR